MHAQLVHRRQQAKFGWDRAVELVGVQVPAQRRRSERVNGEHAVESTEAEMSEVSTRRGWREGRAGGRSETVHAQLVQRRQQAKVGWDRAVELVGLQVPAQRVALGARRVGSAPTESVR